MAAYAHDTNFFTGRTVVLAVIIGLHLFIAWALATGLARKAIEVLAPPIQTDIVQEDVKKNEPPPPPPPEFQKPPVEVPPPDVTIDMPVETTNNTAISNVTTKHTEPPPPVAKATTRTAPGPGKGFPATEDYYPSASRRLEEQGVVVVNVCVDTNGKLSQAPTVEKGSGSPRLDEGGLKLAQAGSGHYKPATEDGKPVAGCGKFAIRFQLR
jgi:periplasmic protein TonB